MSATVITLTDNETLTIERGGQVSRFCWLDMSDASQRRILKLVGGPGWQEHEHVDTSFANFRCREYPVKTWWRGCPTPVDVQEAMDAERAPALRLSFAVGAFVKTGRLR